MFSVLISIYFLEKVEHFSKCLESIWSEQTLKPSEIIIVEDGPISDELDELINSWELRLQEKLKRIKLPKNIGTGLAKNIGLQNCSYEYVCVVDSDDISIPTRFEQQIEYLCKHPNISIVGGQIAEFVGDIQNIRGVRRVPLSHNELQKFATKRSP